MHAGLAGFYIIRDEFDTGLPGNSLNLPANDYDNAKIREFALAIQDRMFKENGELFYPAFEGDPFYEDFITGEGVEWSEGQPTALAEFFGDHFVVNGKIWPKLTVDPALVRLRLLNGCDSRFLGIQFYEETINVRKKQKNIPFTVIGGDQGFVNDGSNGIVRDTLVMETGSRYDILFDFRGYQGKRIIMKNIGGDEPFGGTFPGVVLFPEIDRIMAFDVAGKLDDDSLLPADIGPFPKQEHTIFDLDHNTRRKVGLFEGAYAAAKRPSTTSVVCLLTATCTVLQQFGITGRDEYGRLMPLLGTVEKSDKYWPATHIAAAGTQLGDSEQLMEGTIAWHSPTTENPDLDSIEIWEIWNLSADAHPIHLHLVNFAILDRYDIIFDSNADADAVIDTDGGAFPKGDGTYLTPQVLVQHNLKHGEGFKVNNPTKSTKTVQGDQAYVEAMPKDTVTAFPGQVTEIKVRFDKPGRYVWHCHILSHEGRLRV